MNRFFVASLFVFLASCASNGSTFDEPSRNADVSSSGPVAVEATDEGTQSASSSGEGAANGEPIQDFRSRYQLSTGDVISIKVFNEPDLSLAGVKMTEAGSIQYISTGEVVISGMTTAQVEELITTSLKDRYLRNPKVTVTIDEYRPYFMSGEVNKKGSFAYQPGLTVIKAITIAGGFSPRAAENKIFIQKENDPGTRVRVGHDTQVEPGDIITVEESFF